MYKDIELEIIKVLLVEDDMASMLYMRKFLSKNLCEVHVAEHGKEAVDKYLSHDFPFDVIVTDILMPKMNGLELLMYARAEGYSQTKIIGVTSGFCDYLGSLSLEKFDHLLSKPIDLNNLLTLIKAI